ncbi:MAG: ATP-binding protein [Candidatus Micrarchaeota archaeon]
MTTRLTAGEPACQRAERGFRNISPLASSAKMSDAQFKEWFTIFITAVNHEIGNSLHVLRNKLATSRDSSSMVAADSFILLSSLQMISEGNPDRGGFGLCRFPREVRERLKNIETGEPNIAAIKDAALPIIGTLRSSLPAMRADFPLVIGSENEELFRFHLNRAITFGSMLCDHLEMLMKSEGNFTPAMISVRVATTPEERPLGNPRHAFSLLYQVGLCSSGLVQVGRTLEASTARASVQTDPIFFSLIAANIISNVKRASELAGAETRVEVSATKIGGFIELRFTDFGCGMDEDVMGKLNSGIPVTTKTEEGEHGIGFGYCRKLAEKMGGMLMVEKSEPGKGTTVLLRLKEAHVQG